MSECKVCGRKNPIEGANFCFYCGASLRETDNGITSPVNEEDEEETGRVMRRYSDSEYDERERAAVTDEPQISRWKILGLMMLLLLPVYGWLFLLGWAIVNVVSSRASTSQKEIAHGMLMFFAAAIVLAFLVSAYLNAHPELMEEYTKMYQEMMSSGGV